MKRIKYSNIILYAVLVVVMVGMGTSISNADALMPSESRPVNVIFLIGDGMGPNQVRMAEDFQGSPLNMQTMPCQGTCFTNNYVGHVTDSAAAGTAIACGVKTIAGRIGMNALGTDSLPNIREFFEGMGKSTGLVTTTSVADATPAAFGAHNLDRSNFTEITSEYIELHKIDVILGGGVNHFFTRVLYDAEAKGYTIVRNRDELLETKATKLIGLFGGGNMLFEHLRDSELTPSLEEMTAKALSILEQNPKGFFLMVEGGLIDRAGHLPTTGSGAVTMWDKIKTNVEEVLEFDKAVKVAIDFAERDGKTLVIVTADHETGDLRKITGGFDLANTGVEVAERIQYLENNYMFLSAGHSGVGVPIFSFGPGAAEFSGKLDNTAFYHKIIELIEPSGSTEDYLDLAVAQ